MLKRAGRFQPGEQAGKALLGAVVSDGHGQRFGLANQDDQLFASRNTGINEVPLQQEVMLGGQGNDDGGKLRALRFVDGDGVGQRQFIQLALLVPGASGGGRQVQQNAVRQGEVGGGGFSKWMFWAIVMITLPQVFGWFAFWGVGAPLPGGGIGNGWMSGFSNDAVIFVNTFVIGRLVPVLAAWMVLRSVIDWSEGYTPLASILGAMFLLAIPASAALLQSWNDGTRFGTAAVLEGAWTYTASRIMPIAAGLAVIGAVVNFAFGRPAIRLIGSAAAFLTVSALWRLVVSMM